MKCRHIGKLAGLRSTDFGDEPEYACAHPSHKTVTACDCVTCDDFLVDRPLPTGAESRGCRHPTGTFVDREGRECPLADLYKGASAFLFLGGPSTRTQPLELLSRRGVLLMSINNCPAGLPAGIRPHVWLHTDSARKFHWDLWHDPGVLKIVPINEWDLSRRTPKCLRHRDPQTGDLVDEPDVCARDMPGVLGFRRNTSFRPEEWLFEPTINRGNDLESATGLNKKGRKVAEPNGWPQTINTMFAALRMAFTLGIERLYLLGADFHMSADNPYCFEEAKGAAGLRSNNSAYADLNVMLEPLVPLFEAERFEICNCTPDSGLYLFDYVRFEDAIEEVTGTFEQKMDCHGYYLPEEKPQKTRGVKTKSEA